MSESSQKGKNCGKYSLNSELRQFIFNSIFSITHN